MRAAILISLFLLAGAQLPAQQRTVRQHIVAVSDSLRLRYPYATFWPSVGDDIQYQASREKNDVSFRFPFSGSPVSQRAIFSALDSIAQTPIYTNRYFAHKMFTAILHASRHAARIKEPAVEMLRKILKSDMDHCLAFTDPSALEAFPSKYLTPELMRDVEKCLNGMKLSREDAGIFAQSRKPAYSLGDTLGFARKDKLFSILAMGEKYDVRRIRTHIFQARTARMTLGQYYDSLNQVNHDQFIASWTGHTFISIQRIVALIGDKRVNPLAPALERLHVSNLDKDWTATDIPLILARLQYKSYPNEQIAKYAQAIDTCVRYFSPERNSTAPFDTTAVVREMDDVYNKLCYIGTRQAFHATSPLLLVRAKVPYDEPHRPNPDRYVIGTRFFMELNEQILNLPWNEAKHKRVKRGQPAHVVNEWYIENKLPADFLDKMYQWMVSNVDRYRLMKEPPR